METHAELPPIAPDAVDLGDPIFEREPHGAFRTIRDSARVARTANGGWLVTHHADASRALRDPALSRELRRRPAFREHRPFGAGSTLERMVEHWLLFTDPPAHTRLRAVMAHAFRAPAIAALRGRVEAITRALFDALPQTDGATFDLMAGVARPLPLRMLCEVLDLPTDDFAQVTRWTEALTRVFGPVFGAEQRVATSRAAEDMLACLRSRVAEARREPKPDTLLGLILADSKADSNADALAGCTDDELLGNLVLLFVAAHEATTHLVGSGVFTLLSHAEPLARLRARPALVSGAVDEVLRYEPSLAWIVRFTVDPYRIGPVEIPSGQTLLFPFSPINRDPAAFADPERFDIARASNPHLSFGGGVHHCLGARLARLQGEIAFGCLLDRFEHLALADAEPRWRLAGNARGLETLRLRVGRKDRQRDAR